MADRRLQVFDAVARQLSFTKAGQMLFMSQPAVTFQIKQLEEHFHTPLFDRGRNRLCLTPAGELVQVYASTIVGLSFELEKRLGQMTRAIAGPLLVGGSATVAALHLPRVLAQFKRRYPARPGALERRQRADNRSAPRRAQSGYRIRRQRMPSAQFAQ